MAISISLDDLMARYKQFLTDRHPRITTDKVFELIAAAREYLNAESWLESSTQADQYKIRKIRVELRNAAKTILNRATNLDTAAQQSLERFISEQPEFLAQDFKFTTDFFSANADIWSRTLSRFAHQPKLHFLEIGSFEGMSTCWLLKNILTSDSSALTCIDTFDFARQGAACIQNVPTESLSVEQRFDYNIKQIGAAHKVRKIVGCSQDALRSLSHAEFEYIYIDGSHWAVDVLTDAVLSWPLLKKGGLLTFDDYEWDDDPNPLNRPGIAIDAFLTVFNTHYKLVHRGYQLTVEKL